MTASNALPGAAQHLLTSGQMVGDGGARTIWHITWDKNATFDNPKDLVSFEDLVSYFSGAGAGVAPHVLWDPFTGRTAQFFTPRQYSKSVMNTAGGVETNRKGDVCIQVETLFFPNCRVNGKVYRTVAETPCAGLPTLMQWLRSWGVPDVWPMGAPTWSANRNANTWDKMSGHYGHSQVPENDHTDPGPMPPLFSIPGTNTPPKSDVLPPARLAFKRTLVNFCSGADVQEWQRYMHEVRGWTGLTIDGDYGSQSERYCRLFQDDCKAHGWDVGPTDGKAGPNTIYAMLHRPITK